MECTYSIHYLVTIFSFFICLKIIFWALQKWELLLNQRMLLWNIYFFLHFKSESKSVNVWRKEMLQSVYPLYTFPDNIYFVYVPGKNTFEPKINYLLKVFLRLTEKFLRIFLRSVITCVNAACIHLNKMYTPQSFFLAKF